MNWKLKNMAFYILENLDVNGKIYTFLQRHITKSLVINDEDFLKYYNDKVKRHIDIFKKYGYNEFSNCVYYDFGAGGDLWALIGFALHKMNRCICVDINPLIHEKEIRNIFEALCTASRVV